VGPASAPPIMRHLAPDVFLCAAAAVCVQLLVLYVLGGLAGSMTHLAYCWYDAGGERRHRLTETWVQGSRQQQQPQPDCKAVLPLSSM
jgi:hypothetical protein